MLAHTERPYHEHCKAEFWDMRALDGRMNATEIAEDDDIDAMRTVFVGDVDLPESM